MTRRGRTGGVKRVAFRRPCSRPVLGTKFSPDAVRVASRASTPSSTRDAPAESPAPAPAPTAGTSALGAIRVDHRVLVESHSGFLDGRREGRAALARATKSAAAVILSYASLDTSVSGVCMASARASFRFFDMFPRTLLLQKPERASADTSGKVGWSLRSFARTLLK